MELILMERAYGLYGGRHCMECSHPEKGDFASASVVGPEPDWILQTVWRKELILLRRSTVECRRKTKQKRIG
jgi:hypothetical protein